MALRAMCEYYGILTPSPSRDSPTDPTILFVEIVSYLVTNVPHVDVAVIVWGWRRPHFNWTPFFIIRGGVTLLFIVADDWFVGAHTDNSSLSCFNASSHILLQSRWSLDLAVSCRCFLMWEALLWAVLVRACMAYTSKWAGWMYVIPVYLPSQMARFFIRIFNGGWIPGSYIAWIESCSLPLLGTARSFVSELIL